MKRAIQRIGIQEQAGLKRASAKQLVLDKLIWFKYHVQDMTERQLPLNNEAFLDMIMEYINRHHHEIQEYVKSKREGRPKQSKHILLEGIKEHDLKEVLDIRSTLV